MAFEIDFLPVGDGASSGDAIAFRYGNFNGVPSEQHVFIVDGGTKDSGKALVDHVRRYYCTNEVESVISTHADLDHTSGLTVVLENLECKQLVMHRPWNHAPYICDLFKANHSPTGLSEKLEKAVSTAHELECICDKKGIPIVEPFAGAATADGALLVLGPTIEFYQELLPHFRDTPTAKMPSMMAQFATSMVEKISHVAEKMYIETLTDSGVTSAENNSSSILLLTLDGCKILLTADAGIPALTAASDYAASRGIALNDLYLIQVPHHGSRRNVGPTILNRVKAKNALVSVGPDCAPKHPARKVTNAFIRRGAQVTVTAGKPVLFTQGIRQGWVQAPLVPFYEVVEDYA
jgi:beta-lactamase superfamily II metal-dependent hydrolase